MMRTESLSFLPSILRLVFLAAFATVSLASVTTTPVTNWDTSWTASSIQGTVIVIPCQMESENANALLVLLPPSTSSSSLPSFTILDGAFVAWTGFAVDVECVTNQLLQHNDDHTLIYNSGPRNVAFFLASCLRKEAMYRSGRPYAVQALIVQRQRVWTVDPSGTCTLWNAGATAMGREAVAVRKQVHAALQAQATVPSVTQALRIALRALPKKRNGDSIRTKQKHNNNDLPRAFLLCEDREATGELTAASSASSSALSVQTLESEIIREQLRQLSSNDDGDGDTSKQ